MISLENGENSQERLLSLHGWPECVSNRKPSRATRPGLTRDETAPLEERFTENHG